MSNNITFLRLCIMQKALQLSVLFCFFFFFSFFLLVAAFGRTGKSYLPILLLLLFQARGKNTELINMLCHVLSCPCALVINSNGRFMRAWEILFFNR